MTSITQAAEDINGDSSTNVPKTSRYLFFNLYSRINRNGLNITTIIKLGARTNRIAPHIPSTVAIKSNIFQPLERYTRIPCAIILKPASIKNTVKSKKVWWVIYYLNNMKNMKTYVWGRATCPRMRKIVGRCLVTLPKPQWYESAWTLHYR